MAQEYSVRVTDPPADVAGFLNTGNSSSVLSGRVSYTLGLEGPSMTVDTACSSSLVAIHLAARSLRNGECDLALAGGVTVLASPNLFVDFARQGGHAADGRCKAFSDDADGTGFGEGVGVLMLERLSDAQRNGRDILAVISGSAVNQDGASNGLTAPNGPSQERVIRAALASAGLSTSDVDVVEAHGTGTALGDPIEAQAILATYGQDRERPLRLGTVKSNIGHTQAAAGVAGVMKMVLALRHDMLPKTLHATAPSSKVDWSTGSVELLTENTDWPKRDRPRHAGVSSFGLSGTNAHVIVGEAPTTAPVAPAGVPALSAVPWVLSGRSESVVRARAAQLLSVVDNEVDVAFSLATSRSAFGYRSAVVAGDATERRRGLELLASGETPVAPAVRAGGKTAVLFPGQGSQFLGMGRELYESFPVFAAAFDDVVALAGDGVRDVMWGEDKALLDRTEYTQIALFAVEVALFRLVESWGLTPDFVAGHSIGELAAAHVSGVWTLADAVRVVVARGQLMQALPAGGVMVAVDAGEADVLPLLTDGVEVAAVNGPSAVVLSGDEGPVGDVVKLLGERGCRARRLATSHAFHSARMEPMLSEFERVLGEVSFGEPELPVVSNVTGVVADELGTPGYWVRQVRETVRFGAGAEFLASQGVTRFVEVGPGGVLSGLVGTGAGAAVAMLRRDRGEVESVMTGLGAFYVAGGELDWRAVFPGARRVELPTYPFERARYWLDATPVRDVESAGMGEVEHPLLGAVMAVPGSGDLVLSGRMSLSRQPWLADHAVDGMVLFPGTGFLELALCAAEHAGCAQVEELVVGAPLVVPERGAVDLRVVVGGVGESGSRSVDVFARLADGPGEWVRHAFGQLSSVPVPAGAGMLEWPPAGAQVLDVTEFYPGMADAGFAYGPAFHGLTRAWRVDGDGCAEVALPQASRTDAGRFAVHPALLDASLHVLGLMRFPGMTDGMLPFSFSGVRVHAVHAAALRVRMAMTGNGEVAVELADGAGEPVATIRSLTLRSRSTVAGTERPVPDLYRVDWPTLQPSADQSVRLAMLDGTGLAGDVESYVDLDALGGLIDAGAPVPEVVVASGTGGVYRVLELVQAWLADGRFAGSRLAVLSRGAVATSPDEYVADPVGASVWGLVRAAEAENPGRFVVVDHLGDPPRVGELVAALGSGATQVALRDGIARVPRLGRVSTGHLTPLEWDSGRVLVTGGTGTLGRLVARHLVVEHGVRELLLVSRRGADEALRDELAGLGAEVVFAAVDAADRESLAGVLAEFPVSAVVHCAGVLDDGLLTTLTPERFTGVLAAKMTAAENLYELTRDSDLSAFVTFSSGAATVGGAGQANYATANAFLDGFASWLRGRGVRATSLAWGMWDERSEMTRHLTDADVERLRRGGVSPLSSVDGLSLFDTALGVDEPMLLPIRLELSDLDTDTTPAILHNLVRPARRRTATNTETSTTTTFRDRLTALTEAEQHHALVTLVTTQVAAVLGHTGTDAIGADDEFVAAGFDSLTSIELRNQLGSTTGLRLPATIVFDHHTPSALARYLWTELTTAPAQQAAPAATGMGGDTLGALFMGAFQSGKWQEGIGLLASAAKLRHTFTDPADAIRPPALVRLARGPETKAKLVCISSCVAIAGIHQYARFAATFRDERPVAGLPLPGFVDGQSLPDSAEAVFAQQADTLLEQLDDAPFVLLGSSAGGWFANGVGRELERRGWGPSAVVLVDTYLPQGDIISMFGLSLMDGMFERGGQFETVDTSKITAMGWYFELFRDWKPGPLAAPTLLVRATEPLASNAPATAEDAVDKDWRSSWPFQHDILDVAGNHFSVMEDHCQETGVAIENWLQKTLQK
ncbi:hypothetical protein GCM10027436_80640 [Actinophytocola sediminis]